MGLASRDTDRDGSGRNRDACAKSSRLVGNIRPMIAEPSEPPLSLLSVIIPARDEEDCIASTVEHLHLELRLNEVPHEIVVVDDGSSDNTWTILHQLRDRVPGLAPVQNNGPHGFGRAVIYGLDHM